MRMLLLTASLLIFPAIAGSAPISLTTALRTGLAQNPGGQAVRAETDAARAAAAEAKSKRLPRLTLSENFLYTDEPGGSLFIALNQQRLQLSPTADAYNHPPSRSDFETRLQLTQPLYNPDISYGWKQAEKQLAVAEGHQQAEREALGFAIVTAYLEVQRAAAVLDWVGSSLTESREIYRLAQQREAAGTGLKADTLNASVQLAESRRLQLSAKNSLLLAQRYLALQIGSTVEQLEIEQPLNLNLIPPVAPDQPLQRADLQVLELQRQAAVLHRQQSEAAWQPRAQAAAAWSHHDQDYPFSGAADNWLVQAGLTWQLYDGSSRKHATAQALAQERSLVARQQQAIRQAHFDLTQSQLQAGSIALQLEVSQAALAAAEESYQLLFSRYHNGLTPLTELLTAQSRQEKTRSEVVTSQVLLIHNLLEQHYLQGTLLATLLGKKGAVE
jgi:outer membrane protein TolC